MDQLTILNQYNYDWHDILLEDPVRPHIDPHQRIASNREVFVIEDEIQDILAVLCVAYIGNIPKDEHDVLTMWNSYSVACFYSVWSNKKGYGRKIINRAIDHIRWTRPYVQRAVTLSPKTDMARGFHLSNGAKMLRENEDSINYEYVL